MPTIETEYARKSFYLTRPKINNEFRLELTTIENNQVFENTVIEYFSKL